MWLWIKNQLSRNENQFCFHKGWFSGDTGMPAKLHFCLLGLFASAHAHLYPYCCVKYEQGDACVHWVWCVFLEDVCNTHCNTQTFLNNGNRPKSTKQFIIWIQWMWRCWFYSLFANVNYYLFPANEIRNSNHFIINHIHFSNCQLVCLPTSECRLCIS